MNIKNILRTIPAAALLLATCVVPQTTQAVASSCGTSIADSSSTANTVTAQAYQAWKQAYVVDAGSNQLRVKRSANDNYDTVSEGVAYGMLFAVYSNDKTTFDGLWRYAQAHTNQNGIMNWRIASDGSTTGYNGATDADEDMATALIAADTQWGGYKTTAVKQIGLIKKYEIETGSNVLKPGDAWGGSDVLNPSYLTPAYYGVYARYTNDTSWNDVATASYRILSAIKTNSDSASTGYIPDWSTANGYRASGMGYDYGYDGSRAPLRLALGSSWSCDASSAPYLQSFNATNQKLDISKLASSYNLGGAVTGSGDGTPLLAASAAAATVSTDMTYRNKNWDTLVNATGKGYFGDSMRLFGLFVAGGTFTDPLSLKPQEPAVAPAPAQPVPVVTIPKSYSMTSTSKTATTGSVSTASVAVTAPSAVSGALVDLEVYDASGKRVAQKFYENQSLSNSPTSYDVGFTPTSDGIYTVRGGVFTAGWASNLTWDNEITTITAVTPPLQVVAPVPTEPVVVVPIPTPAPVVVAPTPETPAPVDQPTVNPQPAPVSEPVVQPVPSNVSIWWPGSDQVVRDVQPFKAVLDGVNLASYKMYWQVDGGTLNLMQDSYTGAAHKESLVDLSSWSWRASQKYTVTFVAKNTAGEIIAQKLVVITVGH